MGDALKEVLGWLFEGLGSLFGASGRDGLRQAMSILFTIPSPDFSTEWFKNLYSSAWGLGVILSVIVSLIMAVTYRHRTGGSFGGAVQALLYVPKTYMIIFIMPVLAGLGVMMQGILSSVVMSMFGAENSSALDAVGLMTATNPITGALMNAMLWVLSMLLSFEVLVIHNLLLLVLVFGSVVLSLRGLGSFTEGLYETFVGICLVGLVSKPVMLAVLLFGSSIANSAPTVTSAGGGIAFLNFGTLVGATLVPIMLFVIYSRKIAQHVGGRVGVDGTVESRAPGVTKVMIASGAAVAGGVVATRAVHNEIRENGGSGISGTLKTVSKTAADAVATKAAFAGRPEVATVAKAVSVGISRIPNRPSVAVPVEVHVITNPTAPAAAPQPPDRKEGSDVGKPNSQPTR